MALDAALAVEVPETGLAGETSDAGLDADTPDAVEFTFAVTNRGPDPVTLQFRSGRVAEFVVTAADDGVVWRSTDDTLVTMALRTERLDPRETLTETATWDDPRAGSYDVEATLDATDLAVTAEASFDIS